MPYIGSTQTQTAKIYLKYKNVNTNILSADTFVFCDDKITGIGTESCIT